jgi:hypothetical protein
MELKPCPFCGWQAGEDLIDVVYPTNLFVHWIDPDDHSQGQHCNHDRHGAVGEVWHVGCTGCMGGCGAEVTGVGRVEAIANWNRRA